MPRRSKAAAKAAEERRLDKAELAYADQLPVLWSRFPRIDRDVVRTVWAVSYTHLTLPTTPYV